MAVCPFFHSDKSDVRLIFHLDYNPKHELVGNFLCKFCVKVDVLEQILEQQGLASTQQFSPSPIHLNKVQSWLKFLQFEGESSCWQPVATQNFSSGSVEHS